MFQRLFPPAFNNVFPGQKIALWLFYLLTAITLWRSQHHIFAADGGAQSIATIPLDTYVQGGAATVVSVFALWGLAQLSMAFIMLLACIRYKAMIPLLWLFILFEYLGRLCIGMYKPIETIETAPGQTGNVVLPIIALAMLILSLIPPSNHSAK